MESPWNQTVYTVASSSHKTPQIQVQDLTWGSGESGYMTESSTSAQSTLNSSTSLTPSSSALFCDNYNCSYQAELHSATPKLRGGRLKRTASFNDVLNVISDVQENSSLISDANIESNKIQDAAINLIRLEESDDEFSDVFDVIPPKIFKMNYYRPRSECSEEELNTSPRINVFSSATHPAASSSACIPQIIPENEVVNYGTNNNNIEADFVQKFNESQHLIKWRKSSSCPVTPTKSRSPLKRRFIYSPDRDEHNFITTPDKLDLYSPILKKGSTQKEPLKRSASFSLGNRQATVKRLNFGAKHEKNKILYSSLPTSPAKKASPEKIAIKKRLPSKPQAKRSLLISYSGRDRLDLLYMLGVKSDHRPVISKIFSYLSNEDLCRVSLVSKAWQSICITHSLANTRRLKHVYEKRIIKENIFENNIDIKLEKSLRTETRKVLYEMQNKSNTIDATLPVVSDNNIGSLSPRTKRFRNYLQASAGLEPHKRLKMCPKCSEPSQPLKDSDDEFKCTSMSCSYFFCSRCMCPVHTGFDCSQNGLGAQSPPRHGCRPPVRIGTKQSRRNLRRL